VIPGENTMTTPLPVDWSSAVVPATAVCARMAAAVFVGSGPLGAALPLRVRAALAVALAVVALPQATVPDLRDATAMTILGEAFVGAGLGLLVAATCAAAAWAGGIVGSVTGLAWADEFSPAGDPQAAGLARLAWWLGLAGFLAVGGHLAVVAGLVDSFRMIPVGAGPAVVAARVIEAPGSALGLALSLAGPALAAVVTFHVAAAICIRTVRFVPGAGMLQAAAAAVALAMLVVGLPTWLDGFGAAARGRVERDLAVAASAVP